MEPTAGAVRVDDADNATTALLPETSREKVRNRAPKRQLALKAKIEIARQVNEEKRRPKDVACDFAVPVNVIYRVAGAARGDGRYVHVPEKPEERARRKMQPKIEGPMPLSPFSEDAPRDLRGRTLSTSEKEYLAALVNIQRMTAVQVGCKYNLLSDSVSRYARDARTKPRPFQRHGRPHSRLDSESDGVLRSLATREPRLTVAEFKVQLAEQFRSTRQRRAETKYASGDPSKTDDASVTAELAGEQEGPNSTCTHGNAVHFLCAGGNVSTANKAEVEKALSVPPKITKKDYVDLETYKTYLAIYGFKEV